ncbi:hypothetical protein [Kaarinaea lacus]
MCLKKIPLLLLCLAIAACDWGSGGGDSYTDPGPYQLTFSLDYSFQMPHGNQPIRIALVRLTDGMLMEEASGTVSATNNPSFTFMPLAMMERGTGYAVHYWIDSNIGGGTLGVCDPTTNDHQWSTEFYLPTNDINFTVSYQPALMEYVCDTFP